MKIFLSFFQAKTAHPIPAYAFWEYYIKMGVEESGNSWTECTDVDWAEGIVPKSEEEQGKWKDRTWEKTLKFLRNNKPDLFLSYLYPEQIEISAIKEIKKMGIPCVNFFCDNVRLYRKVPKEFKVFDLVWVPEFEALKLYENSAVPYIHLPMPMWVEPTLRHLPAHENNTISFIGSRDIQRQLFFEEVVRIDPNFPLKIYGSKWETTAPDLARGRSNTFLNKISNQYKYIIKEGISAYRNKLVQRNFNPPIGQKLAEKIQGPLDFEAYTKYSRESKITLGVNRYPSFKHALKFPGKYSRLRDIEAPMLGACYVTEYTEGLSQLYDIEKEILTFSSPEELLDQCRRLQDQEIRMKLRIAGQRKALEAHSIMMSLKKIIARTTGGN